MKMTDSNFPDRLRTELAKLALLPEEEIDTSDMPEVTNWSAARRSAFYHGSIYSRNYDIRAVANWFIERLSTLGVRVTNMSLNKILYFLVERYLVERAVLLTSARIEAWDHGPVFREVYQSFKTKVDIPITHKIMKYSVSERKMVEATEQFLPEDITVFNDIIQTYGRLSASRLRELSHQAPGPWYSIWHYRGKTNPGMEISPSVILRLAPQRRYVDE